MPQPFFSIGITTYNRHDLLRETLAAILAQDFADFEVLVGNDFTSEALTGEMLGINDPRIRFINHPYNLREVGNMNALLAAASGRYFTWLFDDDLHEPDFLTTAHQFLTTNGFPPALFSSFRMLRGDEPYQPRRMTPEIYSICSGQEFLRGYFAGRVKVVSTAGLFDTVSLREIVGGPKELCGAAVGLYSEYLFLVQSAQLERIGYLDAPFIVMRAHIGSSSQQQKDLLKYIEAGRNLVRHSSEVLRRAPLVKDLRASLLGICRIHLYMYAYNSVRLEVAQMRFGLGAACRAFARLVAESSITRRMFAEETSTLHWHAALLFLPLQIRYFFLILAWLIVFRIRRFVPGFMKLTRSHVPR